MKRLFSFIAIVLFTNCTKTPPLDVVYTNDSISFQEGAISLLYVWAYDDEIYATFEKENINGKDTSGTFYFSNDLNNGFYCDLKMNVDTILSMPHKLKIKTRFINWNGYPLGTVTVNGVPTSTFLNDSSGALYIQIVR